MANTIKIKRGLESDLPTLSEGELALTTDTGSLFAGTGVGNVALTGGADFIVETGTSGIWTYRKWNSGIAECWTTSPIESGTHTMTANGNIYASAEHTYPFPYNLFNSKPNLSMCVQQLGGMWGKTGGSTSATVAIVQFLRSNSTTASIQFNMEAKGRWK